MKRKPLSIEVAEKLIESIKNGEYEIGSKIPNEMDLATKFSVSRSTIREAIKQLVSRNILEIHRGNGTYVCSSVGVSNDPIGLEFLSDEKKRASDLCEVRKMIEPELVKKASLLATDDDINKMQLLCDKVAEKIKKGEDHFQEDIDLHVFWANCTHNQVLSKLIPILMDGISLNVSVTNRALTEQTIIYHQAIVDAIKEREPEKAADYMRQHIEFNIEYIKKYV